MGLNMVEKAPISELVSRQQKLSDRLEKKGNLFGGTIPAKIAELDPWTQTDKLLKLGRAGAWLEKSILKVQQSLESNSEEINIRKDELLGKVQTYQGELEQRRIQLAKMEELSTIPATSIAGFKARLAQLESQKDEDPELKLGFQFLQEQEAKRPTPPSPPAAPVKTPPAEEQTPGEDEKRRIEALKQAILSKMGNPDNFILPALEGNQNPLDLKIEELNLSVRSYNALDRHLVTRIGELLSIDAETFRYIRNNGEKNQNDILEALIRFGVSVKPETQEPAEHITQITFNPDNNELTKDGEIVKIPKYFGVVIKYLTEHPGEQITYKELSNALNKAGSKTLEGNVTAAIIEMVNNAGKQGLGKLIQKDQQAIKSGKRINYINVYSLSPEYAVTIHSGTDKPPVPPVKAPAKPEDQNLLVSPVAYQFDPEKKTLQVGDKKVKLTEGRFAIFNYLYQNLGEYIDSGTLNKILADLGSNSKTTQILLDTRKSLGIKNVPLVLVIREGKGGSAKYALGISPNETETSATGEVKTKIPRWAGREMIQLPDDEEIELSSYKARLVQYLNSSKAEALDTTSIINHIWPEDNKPMIRKLDNLQKLIRDTNIELELKKWKIVNAAGGRGHKAKYYLEKIVPAKGAESTKDYSGKSAKFKRKIPDGQEIEIQGYITATAFDLIINSTKDKPIPTEKISHNTATRLREILKPDYEIILIIDGTGRKSGQKGAYYLEKIKTQIPPEQQEEIARLVQSMESLNASRPSIAEALDSGLPGNYAADLQRLDESVIQIQNRLKELGQD